MGTQKRIDTKDAQQAQRNALDEANSALQAVKTKHEDAAREREVIESERDEHESGLAEIWGPLKASELDGKQKWRERERLLKVLTEKMTRLGIDKSLLAALPVALKVKIDERGPFGQVVLSRAEEAYLRHIESLKERLRDWQLNHSVCMAEISEAEATVDQAKEAVEMVAQASSVVEQDWSDAVIAEIETKKKIGSHEVNAEALQQKLGEARADHACVVEMCKHFVDIRSENAALSRATGAVAATVLEKLPALAVVVDEDDEDEAPLVEE